MTVDVARDIGPGAVIDPYLPQPGHYVGRRVVRVEDTPEGYWLASASEAGTGWAEALGLARAGETWEIRRPERLVGTWFARRRRIRRGASRRRLHAVESLITRDAVDTLVEQGTLRNWVTRGGAAARVYDYDPATGATVPGTSGPVLGPDDRPGPGSGQGTDDASLDFQHAIRDLHQGTVEIPISTWGGGADTVPVDVAEPPRPSLFIIQVIGITSFLGDYGLGRTVKTFSLLPGETTTLSTRTWRATAESVALASSIVDSYTESASDRFAETVMSETTDTSTRDSTENWHAEAEVKGSFGFGSASVSGGGGGEYSSSTEEFAKAVDEAVNEHAAESSSQRENTVTSSSERSETTENEEVTERTISNINVRRVLNFTFRELNQVYLTRTHLKEVRIAFSNGNSGSWREEPVSGMRKLVAEVVDPSKVDAVCQDLLRAVAIVFDVDGQPVPVLEQVTLDDCGTTSSVAVARPDDRCRYPSPTADGRRYYRFRRGPLGQAAADDHRVDGVLLKERELVMATDSVVVEALLGQADALDEYSQDLQVETIREKELANRREVLAQKIVDDGDADAAALFAQVFPPPLPTTGET